MLNDPEFAKEVEEMMNNPSFKASMEQYTKSPEFKAAMENAADALEVKPINFFFFFQFILKIYLCVFMYFLGTLKRPSETEAIRE